MAKEFPRGIAPDLLVAQVRNTAPWLFKAGPGSDPAASELPPARAVRDFAAAPGALDHLGYFGLCLSSHFLTCGTPVPTDVDNQIRRKLWPTGLPLDTALAMSGLVLEFRGWDSTAVSTRWVRGAPGTEAAKLILSGHLGEWYTVAAAAYCALGVYRAPEAQARRDELLAAVAETTALHGEVFASLWRARRGLDALRAAANIAHNFGDLDRVMDLWELAPDDALRRHFYKLGARPFDEQGRLRHHGRLWTAGELYKSAIGGSALALENHRHFALRKPRCLRRSPDYLVPLGPFFDDWGLAVARGLRAEGDEAGLAEVVAALAEGWQRLPRTVGYGRALRGLREGAPGLDLGEVLRDHRTRRVIEAPRESFEHIWNEGALRELDEIPSRAR